MSTHQKHNPLDETFEGLKIGVLGGSFNPAHKGHLHISLLALKHFNLDQVWWLVTPGNPLKSSKDLAPIKTRMARAAEVAAHPRIKVADLEGPLGLRFTVDTLAYLKTEYPKTHFLWMMGADCLETLHTWKNWEEIMALVPIGVINRPGYKQRALGGIAATKFKNYRVDSQNFETLAVTDPPAWGYIRDKGINISATKIRNP